MIKKRTLEKLGLNIFILSYLALMVLVGVLIYFNFQLKNDLKDIRLVQNEQASIIKEATEEVAEETNTENEETQESTENGEKKFMSKEEFPNLTQEEYDELNAPFDEKTVKDYEKKVAAEKNQNISENEEILTGKSIFYNNQNNIRIK